MHVSMFLFISYSNYMQIYLLLHVASYILDHAMQNFCNRLYCKDLLESTMYSNKIAMQILI